VVNDRETRFRAFVQHNHRAVAAKATACFEEYERGVVVIRVRHLDGEEEFKLEQSSLPLEYKTLDDYMDEGGRSGKFDTEMLNILRRYEPESQAVVVARYEDGAYDFAVIKAGKAMASEAISALGDDDDDDEEALLGAAMGAGAAPKDNDGKAGKSKSKGDVPMGEEVSDIPKGKKAAKPAAKKKKEKKKKISDKVSLDDDMGSGQRSGIHVTLSESGQRSAVRPGMGDSGQRSSVRAAMVDPKQASAIRASLREARSGRSAIRRALEPDPGEILRDRVLMVKLSKDEMRAIDAIADAMDQPDTATWARRALLDAARQWGKELKKSGS